MEFFWDVESFLRENENLSPVCRATLLELFDDSVTARDLDIELSALIDAGKHFVKATYHLEGDGPLVFSCYERLSALAHAIAIESYPNTEGKAHEHTAASIQELKQFSFISDAQVVELVEGLLNYLAI